MKNYQYRLKHLEQKIKSGRKGNISDLILSCEARLRAQNLPEGSPDRVRLEGIARHLDPDSFVDVVEARIKAAQPRTEENKKIMQMVPWARDEVPQEILS